MNVIYFDNKNLNEYELYCNGRGTYNAPAKSFEMIPIKGKSGDIPMDNKRFENIEITYQSCWIAKDFDDNISDLKAFLLSRKGYCRLEDTYHPNEFRKAMCINAMDIDVDMYNKFGSFDLVFNCMPQRFLKTGETTTAFTANGTINNPTLFESKPLIRVYGTGAVGIGSNTITILEADSYTDIDCELMDAFKGTESKNNKIRLTNYQFPTLTPGNNGVSLGSGITRVEITPRWWTI